LCRDDYLYACLQMTDAHAWADARSYSFFAHNLEYDG
jgi:hypothetical protein